MLTLNILDIFKPSKKYILTGLICLKAEGQGVKHLVNRTFLKKSYITN